MTDEQERDPNGQFASGSGGGSAKDLKSWAAAKLTPRMAGSLADVARTIDRGTGSVHIRQGTADALIARGLLAPKPGAPPRTVRVSSEHLTVTEAGRKALGHG